MFTNITEIFCRKNNGEKRLRPLFALLSVPGLSVWLRKHSSFVIPGNVHLCCVVDKASGGPPGPVLGRSAGWERRPGGAEAAAGAGGGGRSSACRPRPLLCAQPHCSYIYRSAGKSIFRWKNARVNGVCKAVYFYSIWKLRCPFHEIFFHQLLALALITTTWKLLGIQRLLSQAILAL